MMLDAEMGKMTKDEFQQVYCCYFEVSGPRKNIHLQDTCIYGFENHGKEYVKFVHVLVHAESSLSGPYMKQLCCWQQICLVYDK